MIRPDPHTPPNHPPSLQTCVAQKDSWPCWPVLPIKMRSRTPGEFPRLGVLVDCDDKGIRFIADTNICNSADIVAKLDTAPTADIAALEAAGWVVD